MGLEVGIRSKMAEEKATQNGCIAKKPKIEENVAFKLKLYLGDEFQTCAKSCVDCISWILSMYATWI